MTKVYNVMGGGTSVKGACAYKSPLGKLKSVEDYVLVVHCFLLNLLVLIQPPGEKGLCLP